MSQTRNNLNQLSGQLFLNNEETEITAKIEKKEPSIIGLLLLIFITLSVYSLGIDHLNNGPAKIDVAAVMLLCCLLSSIVLITELISRNVLVLSLL